MASPTKIFCIGFHKTGTTSLYAALKMLGLNVTGTICHKWSAEEIARKGADACIDHMKNFDAAEDMPWPHFFKDLDAAYPGSKFILSLRDADSWFASVNKHFGDQLTELNAFAYGREKAIASENKSHWQSVFAAHHEDVRAYFRDRPEDLLEMDLTKGDGWDSLCPFLGIQHPTAPFPVKNTSEGRKSWSYRLKRKFWLATGQTPHPERLI